MVAVALADVVAARVVVGYEPPTRQNRLTVAFRVILAIPHYLFFWILTLISIFAAIAAWFVALVTGRIPAGLHNFLAQVVRYGTRIYSYTMLLTDRYPPFNLSSDDFPVSVEIPRTRLNRVAVLFRLILQIPAYLLLTLVGYGMWIAGPFIWLIVLISGRMPRSVFEAVGSTIRYQTRYYAYMALLSPAYPAGLFGDRAREESAPFGDIVPAPVAPPTVSWPKFPGADSGDIGADSIPAPPTGSDLAAPSWPAWPWTSPVPAIRPRATTLVLSRAGKRLVALFLVLGVLYYVGSGVATATLGSTSSALADVEDAHATLSDAVHQFQTQAATCQRQSDFGCLQSATEDLSAAFDDFGSRLTAIDLPSSAQSAADELLSVAGRITDFLNQLATSSSPQAYAQQEPQFEALGNQFDQAYQRLVNTLS
jgi:hypothetical protein